MTIDKSAATYVAGHRGLAGSAIWRRLEADGYTNLTGRTSAELDLRDREATFAFFRELRPRHVILAAARVGGILANDRYSAEFLSDNLRMQVNVLDAAHEQDVERLVFLGSSCIYPKLAPQPIKEEYLLTGPLEPTNDAYAIAKIAGIMQVQSARKQYGHHWVSAMPTNLYGPGDNFSPRTSHVLPALIRRYSEAEAAGLDRVTNWGSGAPQREFLHVDDLARAIVFLMQVYDSPEPINIGTGKDQPIRAIAQLVATAVGFTGTTEWDTSKPDGTPRKLLDVSRIKALGWSPEIALEDGVRDTVQWFHEHRAEIRA